jgi:hypothetical protein
MNFFLCIMSLVGLVSGYYSEKVATNKRYKSKMKDTCLNCLMRSLTLSVSLSTRSFGSKITASKRYMNECYDFDIKQKLCILHIYLFWHLDDCICAVSPHSYPLPHQKYRTHWRWIHLSFFYLKETN